MNRPDINYKCYLGVYDPAMLVFYPNQKYDSNFNAVATTPADTGGCLGSIGIFTFDEETNSPKAILVSRPFRENSVALVRWKNGNSWTVTSYDLHSGADDTPRLIWLPDKVQKIAYNIRIEDMGYEPAWFPQNQSIPLLNYETICDRDFINNLGLYCMYEANPYYSKFQVNKEQDSDAAYGRFLRDKVTTDLNFRRGDFDRIYNDDVTEYAVCAVSLWEHFEDDPTQDYIVGSYIFNRADAEINCSEGSVTPKLKPLDAYTWFLERYKTKKNLVGINATKKRAYIQVPPIMQFYLLGDNSITNICGDYWWEQSVDANDDATSLGQLGFGYITSDQWWTQCPYFSRAGSGNENTPFVRILYHNSNAVEGKVSSWGSVSKNYNDYVGMPAFIHALPFTYAPMLRFRESNRYSIKPTEFGIYQPDQYYTNEYLYTNQPCTNYLAGVKSFPVFRNSWGSFSCWVDLQDISGLTMASLLESYTKVREVPDAFTLDSVIDRLMVSYGLSIPFNDTITNSQLLYGYGSTNRSNCLKLDKIYLTPATNVSRGIYTQAAQKLELSLKDILDDICNMCNAGWHIDKDGLHIEGNEWYDAGHSYDGISYNPQFDFESVADEFSGFNTLFGQLVEKSESNDLWHTLKMDGDDDSTEHFKATEMQAKAAFCQKETTVSPLLCYDVLRALIGMSDDDTAICLGLDSETVGSETQEHCLVKATKVSRIRMLYSVIEQKDATILNSAFSWPHLKGRQLFNLPADRYLMEWGWMQNGEYSSNISKAYTKPHKSITIRMPVVSELYIRNWQLTKTTLGYGIIRKINIDLITRVADLTVDILENKLQ